MYIYRLFCMYECMNVCTYVMYGNKRKITNRFEVTNICVCMCVCMFVCMYVCLCYVWKQT
jgi:hypothetical protein